MDAICETEASQAQSQLWAVLTSSPRPPENGPFAGSCWRLIRTRGNHAGCRCACHPVTGRGRPRDTGPSSKKGIGDRARDRSEAATECPQPLQPIRGRRRPGALADSFQPHTLQHQRKVKFYCFTQPQLWDFVTAALGDKGWDQVGSRGILSKRVAL